LKEEKIVSGYLRKLLAKRAGSCHQCYRLRCSDPPTYVILKGRRESLPRLNQTRGLTVKIHWNIFCRPGLGGHVVPVSDFKDVIRRDHVAQLVEIDRAGS